MAVVFILTPVIASAQFTGGSSSGSSAGVTSVSEFRSQCDLKTSSGGGLLDKLAKTAVEGAKCDEMDFTLQGHIVSQIDGDLYEFKDETGSVTVEIDDFNDVKVGPNDLVRLTGEADYEETGLVLEVERLKLVK